MTRGSFFKSLAILGSTPSIVSEINHKNEMYCMKGPNGDTFYWIDNYPVFDFKSDKLKWVTVQDNFIIEYVV